MSFYTSLTGLKAATTELALTSNNIANVGTSGFKKSRASFGDIALTEIDFGCRTGRFLERGTTGI